MQYLCLAGIGIILIPVIYSMSRRKPPSSAAGKKDFTPVYLSLSDKPENIAQGMDRLVAESQRTETAGQRWRWLPLFILAAGFGLLLLDVLLYLLGYSSIIFSIGAVVLWAAALVLTILLRRNRAQAFPPRYAEAKKIFHTLRDDLRPNSTFMGHLDLTGALLPSKVAREAEDTNNRTTQYFRDEWLNLKAKLYDGNVLRVSAIQRSKQRKPYTKRSRISGKIKFKPAKFKGSEQQLKVRLVVNPEVYSIVPNAQVHSGVDVGKYKLTQVSTDGGMISLVASSPFEEVEADYLLSVLRSAYSLLQRKAA